MIKLNLGCGNNYFDGFCNIDNDSNVKADIYLDLETNPLPFETDTVHEVHMHHILEHLAEGYFNVIKEVYRVCKNNAKVFLTFPHHCHRYFYDDPTHKRPITFGGIAMLDRDQNDENRAKGYSDLMLAYHLDVNYKIIETRKKPDKRFLNSITNRLVYPDSVMEEIELSQNNVIEEVSMELAVIK